MTVIAAFGVNGCPILFGDLLLSGHERSDSTLAIPSIGDVRNFFPEGSGWSITGLKQKVALVSGNCAIAWAGSALGANIAIAELRDLASRELLTDKSVQDFMDHMNEDTVKLGTSFLGFVESNGRILQFWRGSQCFHDPDVGPVCIAGSGVEAVKALFNMGLLPQIVSSGDFNPAIKAATAGLAMGGLLLRAEHATGKNLLEYFGGGYEVATYSDGGFIKIGDMTYVMWEADVSGESVRISHPIFIVKQRYVDDFLLLRSARIESKAGELPRMTDEQIHAVLPIYKSRVDVELPQLDDIDYESRLLCHVFFVRSGDDIGVYTRVERRGPDSELTMTFGFDGGGSLVVGINDGFVRSVANAMRNLVGRFGSRNSKR